jgi:flagellar capping protein FliD
LSLDYTTLASIKNGSYKKLLNAYYSKTDSSSDSSSSSTSSTSTSSTKINAASVRDNAADLSDSIDALNKSSLWQKKETTDEDGNKTTDYDTDAIYKAVKSYVDNYNTMISSTGNSSDNTVLRSASTAVSTTKANKNLLAEIGISIGSDNKLTVDEETFKSADMTTVKSLFKGSGSYGKSIQSNTSMKYGAAVTQLAKASGSTTYSSSGSYSYISSADYSKYL